MKQPPNTIAHYNQLWARLVIPADVRDTIGNVPDRKGNQFLRQIGPTTLSYSTANALAAGLVAGWKQQIQSARSEEPWTDYIVKNWTPNTSLPKGDYNSIDDAISMMGEDQLRDWLRTLLEAAQTKPRQADPATVENGSAKADEPFLDHFDDWKAKTHLKGKTLDQAASDMRWSLKRFRCGGSSQL